ncbi:DUF4062 domain-containing protein [Brucella anthropi]|uniref:DUF4062 domain-containing protein n=2 Tax=Pseudomonadota TaxID=1224 RepID=UPI001CFC914C|nr:DUF4062 domain-containing protein [Brucella anthropi]
MSDKLKVIRIFIGSPGGLDEERQAAHDVVNSVNKSHSEKWGLFFKLLGWENVAPGFVRPQEKINQDLDKCDYFIGVLWNHWGSRPSVDLNGPASGFEEEYLRAKQRKENGLMKDIAIYFKHVDIPAGLAPNESYKKVIDFKQQCIDEKSFLFKEFNGAHEFSSLVREKLEEIGWDQTDIDKFREAGQSDQKIPQTTKENQTLDQEPADSALESQAKDFLINFAKSKSREELMPAEVARLRLIGSSIRFASNDEDIGIGAHDANLIYREFNTEDLSRTEISTLIDVGIVGFSHQNVPLWHWMVKENVHDNWARVKFRALVGREIEQKNALEILTLGDHSIPTLGPVFDKEKSLAFMLSNGKPEAIFDAAVSYLTSKAEVNEIPLIEAAASKCSVARKSKIEGAIVGILARKHPEAALKRLLENEVDKIEKATVDTIFRSPQSLSTSVLIQCLSAKAELVRLRAVEHLYKLREVSDDTAELLLTDSNYEVRLWAAEALKSNGRALEDSVVRASLSVLRRTLGLSLFYDNKKYDEEIYNRYRRRRLEELSYNELFSMAERSSPSDNLPLDVLYQSYRSKSIVDIRNNLEDGFVKWFDSHVAQAVKEGRIASAMEDLLRARAPETLKNVVTSALSALCGHGKPEDIYLVRRVISKYNPSATEDILLYLGRYGDWSDSIGILRLGRSTPPPLGLLQIDTIDLPTQRAAALVKLGKGRIADLLNLEMDDQIRVSIARLLPKKIFNQLGDDVLMRELNRRSDNYRATVALRCIESLSRLRLSRFFQLYKDSPEHGFYNCVHWLDMGVSLPSNEAKRIAGRALESIVS